MNQSINASSLQNGVHYNNEDNKENKDKVCGTNNVFSSSSSGPSAYASASSQLNSVYDQMSLEESQERNQDDQVGNQQPTPALHQDLIKRALIQLFDNGENSPQRYKAKIRLNLVDDENPEFVASLTRDMRNFKKYIPEECRDEIIKFATDLTQWVKQVYGVKPHLGKFHLNQGRGKHVHSQVEPYCVVGVWWDPDNKAWSGWLKMYDWDYEFDLFTEYLTANQKAQGCKGQHLFTNPKFDTKVRPKTWAQQRAEKAAK